MVLKMLKKQNISYTDVLNTFNTGIEAADMRQDCLVHILLVLYY